MKGRILVIDDDKAFRFAIAKALRRLEFEVAEAASGEEAPVPYTPTALPTSLLRCIRVPSGP